MATMIVSHGFSQHKLFNATPPPVVAVAAPVAVAVAALPSVAATSTSSSSWPGPSGSRLPQWRKCGRMNGESSMVSVGRQIHFGSRVCGDSLTNDWRSGGERPLFWLRRKQPQQHQQRSKVVTAALSTPATAAVTALVVGGAIFALIKLRKDGPSIFPTRKECESCGGSGICPTCKGEGFVNKELSPEAAAKARARAKDAATRNTAGLARKWNYCKTCSGSRGCRSCEGRGWVEAEAG